MSETGSEKRPDHAAGGVDDVLMGQEWGMKRKNHNNRQVELPNFCHLGVNLRIALTVEAALVAGGAARAAGAPGCVGGWMQRCAPRGGAMFALRVGAGRLGYFTLRARALSPAITEARLQALQA